MPLKHFNKTPNTFVKQYYPRMSFYPTHAKSFFCFFFFQKKEGFSFSRYLKFRKLSEFVTTETELKAMAAPAIMGFKKPSAAKGMPMML